MGIYPRPKGVLPPFRSAPKRVKKYQNSEFWTWMAYPPPPFIFFKYFLFSNFVCALFKVRVSVFRNRTNFGINDSILAEIANMSKSPFSKMVKKSNQWGFKEENGLKFFFLQIFRKIHAQCHFNLNIIFSVFFVQIYVIKRKETVFDRGNQINKERALGLKGAMGSFFPGM